MCEDYPGEDEYGILEDCCNQKEIDEVHDKWDEYYGKGYCRYEVYVLMDSTIPGKFMFGPLVFDHEPFYVGHGRNGRAKISASIGRQQDKYNFKSKRMKDIQDNGGYIRWTVINRFKTKTKAFVVEKKIMNLIPRNYLTNSLLHLCEVPLLESDYTYMINSTEVLTV